MHCHRNSRRERACAPRHCEEHLRRSNPASPLAVRWIASLTLAMTLVQRGLLSDSGRGASQPLTQEVGTAQDAPLRHPTVRLRRPPFAGMTVVDRATSHDRPAIAPYIGP